MNNLRGLVRSLVLATVLLAMATATHATPLYYVGVDGLQTNVTGLVGYPIPAMYSGLPNPNYNRLTFLVADLPTPARAHFHGVGAYSYSGPASNPTVESTYYIENGFALNRVPETFTSQPPLPLVPGTGVHAGHLISQAINGLKYSDFYIQSIQALNGFPVGSLENYLFNSTNGRWNQDLTGSQVGLQLVSISTGLHLTNETGTPILQSPGEIHLLGLGNLLAFTPTFWTDNTAAAGTYSAEFRLLDLDQTGTRTPFGQSGTFHVDFQVVPEPTTWSLLALGMGAALGLQAWRRRRHASLEKMPTKGARHALALETTGVEFP